MLRPGEGDSVLASYLDDISSSTPLAAAEEAELAARIRAGDESARNELVEANLRFVVSVSKEYQNRGLSLVELISAGNVGLITASERFDETRGFKFISYAVWWVRQSILQALMEQSTVRMPVNRLDMLSKISRTYEALQQDGSVPSMETVADTLGFSQEKIEQTLVDNQPIRSLDAPFEDGEEPCLLDYLSPEGQLTPEDEVLVFTLREDIDNVLGDLNEREAEVLRLYFGLLNEPSLTLAQIGGRFQLTRERVRQIKEIALRKLRHPRFYAKLRAHANV
ncbi:MAG TPA: sigma-70 family RNA polymerase sigma factor [Candidatus Latescibacteria bacterium]|nr:sigma-70 family RNA polymerase sigma factor [Candidatus Handelsmanbacteria bacterium]HIL11659.1 sigma-70 family RNA polymerase sigma factor [Candidatus Latescibacterota bacterium]